MFHLLDPFNILNPILESSSVTKGVLKQIGIVTCNTLFGYCIAAPLDQVLIVNMVLYPIMNTCLTNSQSASIYGEHGIPIKSYIVSCVYSSLLYYSVDKLVNFCKN